MTKKTKFKRVGNYRKDIADYLGMNSQEKEDFISNGFVNKDKIIQDLRHELQKKDAIIRKLYNQKDNKKYKRNWDKVIKDLKVLTLKLIKNYHEKIRTFFKYQSK